MQKLDCLGRHCEDVQIKIFSYLERQDLAKMHTVTKKTQKAAATDRLWKEIWISSSIHFIGPFENGNTWKQDCYKAYYELSKEKKLYDRTVDQGYRHNLLLSNLITIAPFFAATEQVYNAFNGMDVQKSLLINAVVAVPLAVANIKSD